MAEKKFKTIPSKVTKVTNPSFAGQASPSSSRESPKRLMLRREIVHSDLEFFPPLRLNNM